MKKLDKSLSIYNKDRKILSIKLLRILRDQFNLRMQLHSRQLKNSFLLKKSRRDVALIKFFLSNVNSDDNRNECKE